MTKKRRNNGKNRKGRGSCRFVRCEVSGRAVPKDKAVKRFVVRNMVDNSSQRDILEQSVYEGEIMLPRIHHKHYYSISAAVHNKVVRARPKQERKIRENPRQARFNKKREEQAKKKAGEGTKRKF